MTPLFNIQSSDYHENIYSHYSNLRENHPVYLDELRGVYMVTRYEDVRALLRQTETLKNGDTSHSYIKALAVSDGDFHKQLRTKAIGKLSQKVAADLEPAIDKIVSDLFSELPEIGEIDIYNGVVKRLPQRFMISFLGFPEHLAEQWYTIGDQLMGDDPLSGETVDPMKLMTLLDELQSLINKVLDYKRSNLSDDMFSSLIQEEAAGTLTTQEMQTLANNFALAGLDTTINLLGNGTGLLALYPEQREKLIANPELMDGAIEEMLRHEAPVQALPRMSTSEIQLHGITIPKGHEVSLVFAAANLDPNKYENPEQFDIERKNFDHLAMGFGLHKCLGQHLARAEARAYFRHLLKKYPNYALGENRWLISWWARGYAALTIHA